MPDSIPSHTANIIKKLTKKNFSILDVGCQTGHFYKTFNRVFKRKINYIGLDPYKIHISQAKKIWKNKQNHQFRLCIHSVLRSVFDLSGNQFLLREY